MRLNQPMQCGLLGLSCRCLSDEISQVAERALVKTTEQLRLSRHMCVQARWSDTKFSSNRRQGDSVVSVAICNCDGRRHN